MDQRLPHHVQTFRENRGRLRGLAGRIAGTSNIVDRRDGRPLKAQGSDPAAARNKDVLRMTCDYSNDARAVRAYLREVDFAAVLTVDGEVDAASAPLLRNAIDNALGNTPSVLVVDLSGVRFFGSAGLSVLLAGAAATGGGLRVVASPPVRRPIEVTGLGTVLNVFDDLAQALGTHDESDAPSEAAI
ncbi:STAS domain-containing protein [Nocardia sp. NPDC051052]|uniref:STAS domain-containing protein n=1 Tax=Nocardia sp. NPDC051052 TaxID=3364322 RepID=UPI003795CB79